MPTSTPNNGGKTKILRIRTPRQIPDKVDASLAGFGESAEINEATSAAVGIHMLGMKDYDTVIVELPLPEVPAPPRGFTVADMPIDSAVRQFDAHMGKLGVVPIYFLPSYSRGMIRAAPESRARRLLAVVAAVAVKGVSIWKMA